MKYKPSQVLKLKLSYIISNWNRIHPEFEIQLNRRFVITETNFNRYRLKERIGSGYHQTVLYSEADLNAYFELEKPIKTILPLP